MEVNSLEKTASELRRAAAAVSEESILEGLDKASISCPDGYMVIAHDSFNDAFLLAQLIHSSLCGTKPVRYCARTTKVMAVAAE